MFAALANLRGEGDSSTSTSQSSKNARRRERRRARGGRESEEDLSARSAGRADEILRARRRLESSEEEEEAAFPAAPPIVPTAGLSLEALQAEIWRITAELDAMAAAHTQQQQRMQQCLHHLGLR